MDDDLWRLRLRRDAFQLPPGRGPAPGGCPSFLGKVVSTGGNLGVNKFCKVNPVDATGTETESAAGTLTADTSTVVVLALGPTAPATGDYLVCRWVNYRWVAEKQTVGGGGGGTTGFTTCCPSDPVPATVSLSFTFTGGRTSASYNNQLVNTTLTYMTTAPAYWFGVFPGPRYVGPIIVDSFGNSNYYAVNCSGGTVNFSLGTAGISPASLCGTLSTFSCSPFLITGYIPVTACSCTTPTSGPSQCFGSTAGDNITIS